MLLNWISLELDITAVLIIWFAVFIVNMKFSLRLLDVSAVEN